MAFTSTEVALIESAMADFMAKRRPREEIRDKLDLAYRLKHKDQSVEIFTIRPDWRNPEETVESEVAKARFRRNSTRWDILWMRASGKWNSYQPHPEAVLFEEFLAIVDEDAHYCFWG
jgi:hypothetical protein